MVFSSLLFLFRFLPAVIILYFIVPVKLRNTVMFAASLFFYGWGEPVYITLLLFSTIVDYTHGRWLAAAMAAGNKRRQKMIVASSAIINLSLLGFFKYSDFVIGAVNQVGGTDFGLLHLALPIGISFYTFQTMSYTIDIYRGQAKVQYNIIDFGAYVSMFPQLIAGPIVRYHTIAQELNERKETVARFALGIQIFVVGLGKKVLLANAMGSLWDEVQAIPAGEQSIWLLWLGIIAYGMQIYFDFSGYSDMAVGLGHMFGFTFPENFRYPYTSKSITEFWRRWHISLGTWFREYVYIPLGGNKKGTRRHVLNIMIVWFLTGIWHGAGWNFLLWGIYFGIWLLLEKFWLTRYLERMPGIWRSFYTLMIVFLGWVLFAHDDLTAGVTYLAGLFGGNGVSLAMRGRTAYLWLTAAPKLLICMVGATPLPKTLFLRWRTRAGSLGEVCTALAGLGIFIVIVAYLVDASYNPFLYFRF